MTAADERQQGGDARHGGEAVEELVLWAEYDRRPQDHGVGIDLADRVFGPCLGAPVERFRRGIGPDGRDLHEAPDPGLARRPGHGPSPRHVHGLEGLAPAFAQDADEIDRHLGMAERRRERSGVADVGLHGLDLPDAAERHQVIGEIGAAAPGHHPEPGRGERPDHVPPEKARAAEDGHLSAGREFRSGHAALPRGRLGF